jgi:5'-deoxynucleotidase YfbR-like HD superfamily hydrolase
LQTLLDAQPDYVWNPDDFIIRESLLEHVGSLPIVASQLYPFIDDAEVDLGHALALLSIHDIGELATGDEITFTKKASKADNEKAEALKLLHPSMHEMYLEIEERRTQTARFAKAIDKITPDILDLVTPVELNIKRYQHFAKMEPKEIVPKIREFKHPYMTWNPFMTGFHLELLDRMEKQFKPYY